eukprot:366026-Chlamydomonas_euryale.AAC.16
MARRVERARDALHDVDENFVLVVGAARLRLKHALEDAGWALVQSEHLGQSSCHHLDGLVQHERLERLRARVLRHAVVQHLVQHLVDEQEVFAHRFLVEHAAHAWRHVVTRRGDQVQPSLPHVQIADALNRKDGRGLVLRALPELAVAEEDLGTRAWHVAEKVAADDDIAARRQYQKLGNHACVLLNMLGCPIGYGCGRVAREDR